MEVLTRRRLADRKAERDSTNSSPSRKRTFSIPRGKLKWVIPGKSSPTYSQVLGRQFAGLKGSGTGKFLRVEKDDGEELAIIEIDFEIAGKSKEDDLTLDVKNKVKATVYRSLKYGFDRKSTTLLNLSMKGGGETDGRKIDVDFEAPERGRSGRTEKTVTRRAASGLL